jgi:mannose-6-phosphate isomerase-like protein (cupin superfamily)
MDGEEIPINAGDVFFIPAGVKHTTINNSETDLRYLEFYTQPPVGADFVEVIKS